MVKSKVVTLRLVGRAGQDADEQNRFAARVESKGHRAPAARHGRLRIGPSDQVGGCLNLVLRAAAVRPTPDGDSNPGGWRRGWAGCPRGDPTTTLPGTMLNTTGISAARIRCHSAPFPAHTNPGPEDQSGLCIGPPPLAPENSP